MKIHRLIFALLVCHFLFAANDSATRRISPSLQTGKRLVEVQTHSNNISICALRVSFIPDESDYTTGDGRFLTTAQDTVCASLVVDPPPHNRAYFKDHIRALSNYYGHVSKGHLLLDTLRSEVYPLDDALTYQLPRKMEYYHPFLVKDSVDTRLAQLFYEAVQLADADLQFADYDLVVVFHAGVGQDFDLDLDPTPYDIPSVYLNTGDLALFAAPGNASFAGIPVDGGNDLIVSGMILPETQNHLLFSNWEEVFGGADEPCAYQIGLNGTFAFMTGFYLGLPGLYNTETGETGVGKFGLMDQGSANLNGLIPPLPTAWSRVFMGWEEPLPAGTDQEITLQNAETATTSSIWKVPIDENEYFLVENRNAELRPGVSLDSIQYKIYKDNGEERWPLIFPLIRDSLQAEFSARTGVLLSVPRYDAGLPGSGLLIWHIDESVIEANLSANKVNIDREHRGVDLEEGDGAQDLGYEGQLFGANVDIGWYFDPWFAGNDGFWDLNPEYPEDSIRSVGLTNSTQPSSRSYANAYTGIAIDQIGPAGEQMNFRIHLDRSLGNFPLPLGQDRKILGLLQLDTGAEDGVLNFVAVDRDSLFLIDSQGMILQRISTGFTSNLSTIATPLLAVDAGEISVYIPAVETDGSLSLYRYRLLNNRLQYANRESFPAAVLTSNAMILHGKPLFSFYDSATDQNILHYGPEQISVPEPIARLAGDADQVFAVSGEGELYLLETAPLALQLLTDVDLTMIGDMVVGWLDDNSVADVVLCGEDRIVTVLDAALAEPENIRQFSYPLKNYYPFPVLADIDGDDKIEIALADSAHIYVFTERLVLEANFPASIPNQFNYSYFDPYLLTSCDDAGRLTLLAGIHGVGIAAFDRKGQLLPNFPVTLPVYNGNSVLLLDSPDGIVHVSVDAAGTQLNARKLSAGQLTDIMWTAYGSNPQRNFSISIKSDTQAPPPDELLDLQRVFNWPNPVKGNETAFRYFVRKSCRVSIQVYDLAGDFVAALTDEDPLVGDYNETVWDVSGVQSGVYFAVVKAQQGSESISKIVKVMIIR